MATATEFLMTDETANGIAEAAEKYINGYITGPNLLDNWYFVNPVNQRGETEYSEAGYTVDRWALGNAGVKVTVSDGGLKLERLAAGTCAMLRTSVDPEIAGELWGRTVTISALIDEFDASGAASIECYQYNEANSVSSTARKGIATLFGNGLLSLTVTLPEYDAKNPYFTIAIGLQNDAAKAGDKCMLIAAKLELGDTQTLAHQDKDGNWLLHEIPDFGEQLWKCQRYYQIFRTSGKCPSWGPDFRPVMRTASPSTGTVSVGGTTYYYADANL